LPWIEDCCAVGGAKQRTARAALTRVTDTVDNAARLELTAVARAGEPERYLAALLAPRPQRDALLALAAFSAEIARIPLLVVHEPAMGEIRLQWWRDALELPLDMAAGHPVADAVRAAARSYDLPPALLDGMVEARKLELHAGPLPSELALRDHLWKTEGSLFALAGRVMGLASGPQTEAASTAAGHAYGLTRLLLGIPQALARERIALAQPQLEAAGLTPQELLSGAESAKIADLLAACQAQARDSLVTALQFVAKLPRSQRVAFLPLALVGSYLRALERPGRASLREEVRLAPLTRVSRIAAAHLFGRL
jgi:15-cis-phytoene synthase